MAELKKITNEDLLKELRDRGFFIIPTDLGKRGCDEKINTITVSVEKPLNNVYTTWGNTSVKD